MLIFVNEFRYVPRGERHGLRDGTLRGSVQIHCKKVPEFGHTS